jgi:hypothetical protein
MKTNNSFFKIILSLLFCSLSFLYGCASNFENSANEMRYTAIQSASIATIEPVAIRDHKFKLVLHHPNPYVIFFDNKPDRHPFVVAIADYIKLWQASPTRNSAGVLAKIEYYESLHHYSTSHSVTLSAPVYYKVNDTLVYTATGLSDHVGFEPSVITKLQNVYLFFDKSEFCFSCLHIAH